MVQCAGKALESSWSSKSLAGHGRAGGLASSCGSPPAMSLQFGCIVDAVSSSPAQQDRAHIRRASLNWKWRGPWTRCPTKLSSNFPGNDVGSRHRGRAIVRIKFPSCLPTNLCAKSDIIAPGAIRWCRVAARHCRQFRGLRLSDRRCSYNLPVATLALSGGLRRAASDRRRLSFVQQWWRQGWRFAAVAVAVDNGHGQSHAGAARPRRHTCGMLLAGILPG